MTALFLSATLLLPLLQQELTHYDRLVKANPQNPNAYVRRGMAHFKLGHITAAIQDFDQAERLNPQLTPYLWQRGLAYYYCDRYEDGAAQFELDLAVNGHDIEETLWRFLCLAQSRGIAEAQTLLLPAGRDPRPFMAAVYAFYAGQISATELLQQGATEGDRGEFYTQLYLGLYYEVSQQPDLAQKHLCRAADGYSINDYMWHLAQVHKELRGW